MSDPAGGVNRCLCMNIISGLVISYLAVFAPAFGIFVYALRLLAKSSAI
jgi:hypothetical protein